MVEFTEIPPAPTFDNPDYSKVRNRKPAIETKGLTKRYGDFVAVDGLSISVPRGKVIGFVGPNGAGKTTTIRMLLGLIRPSAGAAQVLGASIAHPTKYLPKVGALIESPAFYGGLSAEANLQVFARLGGCDLARIPGLLAEVGLAERAKDPYKSFSLGMKQRLGIAAALLPDPELVILDEPTNGLDPGGIHEVRDYLRSLAQRGKTVFVSSHLLSEIQKMCDYVVMLRRGKLVFQGTMNELLARSTGLSISAADPADQERLADLCRKAGYQVRIGTDTVQVHGASPDAAAAINAAAFQEGILLKELHASGNDLEDTFLAMTEGEVGQ